jgi:hypothetical protein
MRRLAALALALGITSVGAQAAIVHYSLTGVTEFGTVISGSFSFDTATIGPNYSETSALTLDPVPLLSFTVSLTSVPGTPTSTSFNLSNESTFFVIATDGAGNLVNFTPGFSTNADGYSLDPWDNNASNLLKVTDPVFVDGIIWQYTQVPELSHTALGAGLGLLGFVGLRAWRNRR